MMGIKERSFGPLPDLSLEELVSEENFYRRLQSTLDLSFAYRARWTSRSSGSWYVLSMPAKVVLRWIRSCSSSSSW